MSNNNPPFYVGQEVVAISTSTQRTIIKGTHYYVHGVMQFKCGCWGVSVGLKSSSCLSGCEDHGLAKTAMFNDGKAYHYWKYFRPIKRHPNAEIAEELVGEVLDNLKNVDVVEERIDVPETVEA